MTETDANNSHYHFEAVQNDSANDSFESVLARSIQRRTIIKGGIGAALASMTTLPLAGCGRSRMDFAAVATTDADTITLPEGFQAQVFIPWGTPITGRYPPYRDGGMNSGIDQEQQIGMHHDGMHFFPIKGSNRHGLLCINHEYIDTKVLHPNGMTLDTEGRRTRPDEVRKEIAAHGVSVIEIGKDEKGLWQVLRSPFNRRITGATPMVFKGPAAGHASLRTAYSRDGGEARGTLGNCAAGFTPWGTYLTCEENWSGYFKRSGEPSKQQRRYGIGGTSYCHWETIADNSTYSRFNLDHSGSSAIDDYRNEANTFGWVVEIDPFDAESVPVKHTAFGRIAHEGIVFHPPRQGEPLVAYSGDDARFEYIYKFVSKSLYDKKTAGNHLLETGTLYVAKFNDDGSGRWLALDVEDYEFQARTGCTFKDQAEVLINARLAADMMGATKMDRPEWCAIHPSTSEVYFTLTNNTERTFADGANPRANNPFGHIIRWHETSKNQAGTEFVWDIFLQSGIPQDSEFDGKPLTEDNFHNSPDGLFFDPSGRLWIETDGMSCQPWGNNQLLAADVSSNELKRFMVGPVGCEVTGGAFTPDVKNLFVNIQHPSRHWPDGGRSSPRSATVILSRTNGKVI